MEPIAQQSDGELIGSGDGSAHGPSIQGPLRWTLFEGPGELLCTMSPTVEVDTEDGAIVHIEGRGFARRKSQTDQRWRVAATLVFSSKDERYAWLEGALGVWEGEFDAERHQAHYRAFVQSLAQTEQ
jgi:hypothetical protein